MSADTGRFPGTRIAQAMAALLLAVAAVAAEAAAPEPPQLRIDAPPTIVANAPRDIVATLTNRSGAAVVVLPNQVRLHIDGSGAEYVPYPGPAIDPWGGVTELAPGKAATVRFRGASDRRGVWRLAPGEHRVRAIYDVPADLAAPATVSRPDLVWRGRLSSPPRSTIVIEPGR